ncbi:MAG: hypothetical protein EOP39_11215 [Rubrivivax sp.]|nr:MAG: hypothetical protein EOP39_11215 [Rubrivivax sp.]
MATTAQAQASCVADFSAFGQGSMTVDIKPAAQEGRVDAVVNGSVTNAGTLVVDETIRAGLNLAPNPDSPEFKQLNSAERSLVHLHWISTTSPTRDVIKLPFAPADVRRLKTIDLIGKTDKFGGQVLMEAFDERGTSLGKVIRRVFAATCR